MPICSFDWLLVQSSTSQSEVMFKVTFKGMFEFSFDVVGQKMF